MNMISLQYTSVNTNTIARLCICIL